MNVMERTDLERQIQTLLNDFEPLYINTFRSNKDEMNLLNPYFGYGSKDNTDGLNTRGVQSIWMAAGVERLNIKVLPRGYGGDDKTLQTADLSNRQLDGVLALVQKLHTDRKNEIARVASNPPLQELLPKINDWAKRCIRVAGKEFSIELSEGRRACDSPQKYHALVVEKEGWQIGSIPLRQDKWGMLEYNVQVPLGGSYMNDFEMTPDNWQDKIKAAVEEIIGKRINMEYENSPAQNIVIDKNRYGEYYITCEIDGVPMRAKSLDFDDRDKYLANYLNHRTNDVEALKRELVAKYFKDSIEKVQKTIAQNNPANGRISDITFRRNAANSYFISCRIDGEKQMSEQLSFSDQRRLDEVLKKGNSQGLETFKQSLAEKYYRNVLQQGQEQKSGWKR